MVASKIKRSKEKELDFPKLMISEINGVIVLFEEDGYGTVMFNDENFTIGEYSDDWIMDSFKDFKGELTLKNK